MLKTILLSLVFITNAYASESSGEVFYYIDLEEKSSTFLKFERSRSSGEESFLLSECKADYSQLKAFTVRAEAEEECNKIGPISLSNLQSRIVEVNKSIEEINQKYLENNMSVVRSSIVGGFAAGAALLFKQPDIFAMILGTTSVCAVSFGILNISYFIGERGERLEAARDSLSSLETMGSNSSCAVNSLPDVGYYKHVRKAYVDLAQN